jgi:GNAT superfamily N-acetyltransferase
MDTQPSYRKRGYATALLKHGFKLADELDYPSYLDAEKDAVSVYTRVGFLPQPDPAFSSPYLPMVRPKKSSKSESDS